MLSQLVANNTTVTPSGASIKAKKIVNVNPLSKKNAFGLASIPENTAPPTSVNMPVVAPSTPLSLQMGGITHAVDDLITGYETLVQSLPTISKTVSDMHQGTEAIAKDLEQRTRSLVHEYEYLEGISSQLPELFHQTAEDYKSALLGNTHFVTEKERETMEAVQKELDRMKIELQSITHERVVVDVLTRPTIKDIQTLRARIPQPPKPSSRVFQATPDVRGDFSTAYPSPAVATALQKAAENKRAMSQIVIPTDPNLPISVPTYIPLHLRGKKLSVGRGGAPGVNFVDPEAPPHSRLVTARSVGNKVIVPNVRVGDLPEDLRNIRTQPMNDTNKNKKKKKVVSTIHGPLTKQLQVKFSETEGELKRLKDQLAKADSRFNKEKSKSMKKLQLIAQMMEEKQLWKDQALLASVDELIQEAMNSFQDVVDEVDLLRMLEEILQSIPLPDDVYAAPQQQDYAVVNVTHQPHVPMMHLPAPVPAPMPAPSINEYAVIEAKPASKRVIMTDEAIQVSTPIEREIQTERPYESTPPPAPTQTIIQPQIIVQRDGVEKDFLQLLQTVIQTHQKAMEGQQALILSLINERGQVQFEESEEQVTPVVDQPVAEEESVAAITEPIVEDQTVLEPEDIVPALDAPQPPVPASAERPKYKTAFGEVCLGGDYFEAPYQVQPQLNFDSLLAMKGLDGQPSVQPPHDAPQLRRRAAPLTMKYLMNMNNEQEVTPAPAAVSNEVNVLDFASKLLDAIKPAPQSETMTKEEMLKVINEGISRGVKEALGYFNQPEPAVVEEQPANKRKLMDRQLKYLDNAFAGNLIGKKDVKTKDSLDSEVIHEEMVKSEAIKHKLMYEEDRYSDGYHDSISLDEEFHARYGRDSFDKRANKIPYHDVQESIHSDSAESGNGGDLIMPKQRDLAKQRRKYQTADSLDSMFSDNREDASKSAAGPTKGLLPLCSNVLPQPATSYMRTKLAKDHSKVESRYLREDSDEEWTLRSDSMDDVHSLDMERDRDVEKRKQAVHAARFALHSEYMQDVAHKEIPALDETGSTNISMASSMSSNSSFLRKQRRNTEERTKRKDHLSHLNAKRKSLDSSSGSSTPEKQVADSFSTTSSSDFGYYSSKPHRTASRIPVPKYHSSKNNKLAESVNSTYSSDASSYRSYNLSHQQRDVVDDDDDVSNSYAESDVSIDFSISSAGSSAQSMARAPVPLLSISGRSSAMPRWKP